MNIQTTKQQVKSNTVGSTHTGSSSGAGPRRAYAKCPKRIKPATLLIYIGGFLAFLQILEFGKSFFA